MAETGSKADRAKAFVAGVLERLGVEAAVEVKEGDDTVALSVSLAEGAEDRGLKSSRRGQVLEALQYLANRAVGHTSAEDRRFVTIDVGGFRDAGATDLAEMADRLAEKVRKISKMIAIGPMDATERRQVHLALAEKAGITTRSEGDGLARRLLVTPDRPVAVVPLDEDDESAVPDTLEEDE